MTVLEHCYNYNNSESNCEVGELDIETLDNPPCLRFMSFTSGYLKAFYDEKLVIFLFTSKLLRII